MRGEGERGRGETLESAAKLLDILASLSAMIIKVKRLGRSQVVRQRVLVPIFVGSNPSAPAKNVFILVF